MVTESPIRYLAISEQSVCPEPVPDRINRLFELGVPAVQLRDKKTSDRTRFNWCRQVESGTGTFLVNGRWDLATLVDADGIHRPSDGLPLTVPGSPGDRHFIHGASTHSLEEVRRAEREGADYVTFGPVFPTPSKPRLDPSDCTGLDGLERVADETNLPVLALGGITPDRVHDCFEAGASGAAGIRALFEPENPQRQWEIIESTINDHFGGR